MEPLSYRDFKALAIARKRAFHLEQRDAYNVESEDEPFGRWLSGEPDDYAWHADWLGFVRKATAAVPAASPSHRTRNSSGSA
jgi:hypothetical protein